MERLNWNELYILPRSFGILGIVLFGFVLLRKDVQDMHPYKIREILNHERIHVKQWVELAFIGFAVWYLLELIIKGYDNNVFEKEAYANEAVEEYLENRRIFNFLKYYYLKK